MKDEKDQRHKEGIHHDGKRAAKWRGKIQPVGRNQVPDKKAEIRKPPDL